MASSEVESPGRLPNGALCSGIPYGTSCSKVFTSIASSCGGRGGRAHCSVLRRRLSDGVPFQVQLAKESTCPWNGGKWPAEDAQLSTCLQHLPQPLLSSIQKLLLGTLAILTLP